jgi:poly(3-hydroxybutyrate) depolymerase
MVALIFSGQFSDKKLQIKKKINMKKIYLLIFNITLLNCFAIDQTGSITSGAQSRSFVFHANATSLATIPQNLPLMIVMHGDGGNGAGIKSGTNFDAVANANNYIVVYPDAKNGSWNRYVDNVAGDAGLGNPNAPDDVQYISDLIDYFCATYKINKNKVYATGHSAGGFMAYTLGLKLSNKIAAIAPVAGSLWGDSAALTQAFGANYVPIPVYHIHGDADNVVSYPDTNHTPVAWQEWPLSNFSFKNCAVDTYLVTSITTIVANVKQITFCGTDKKVQLIRIQGGGHNWPNVAGYNAAEAISQFCLSYSLSIPGTCAVALANDNFETANNFKLYPNPVDNVLNINSKSMIDKLEIYDLNGRLLFETKQKENNLSLDLSFLATGIYNLKIINSENSSSRKIIKN